ncbi:MAG: hypothetical protein JNL11_15350 [Bdellovibrionaceae bacterium]|nr:hypothetical protein [Pseudobdellovibrionaceae bacterium]
MSQYDPNEMHDFLSMTPEKGLRQILVDNKSFSNDHFSMLLKIVRTGNKESFCEHYTKNDFPKIKFSPNETKIKETFWATLTSTLGQKGIIQPVNKAA